jgi:hypothetical protein
MEKNMKTKGFITANAVMMLTVFTTCVWALPEVLSIKGNPKILRNGTDKWTECAVKMVINNGDKISTSKNESVEISSVYVKKNIVKIGPESEALCFFDKSPYSVELLNGEAVAFMANLPKNSLFEVRTPAGISGAKNTGWMGQTDGKVSTFTAFANTIYVKGINLDGSIMAEELLVDRGYLTVVKKYEKPMNVTRASQAAIAEWNNWREEISRRDLGVSREGQ